MENSKNRPTREEITDFILNWKERPETPPLAENEITIQKLKEISGFGYSWAKVRLREMEKNGLCTSYPFTVKGGITVKVYVFEKLPKF